MGEAVDRLREKLLPIPAGRYLIGLSGGADSVALLEMILPLVRQGDISAEAVHINHCLRGQESDRDETFVRDLCRREQIPLHVYRADLKGRKDEASARAARFEYFRECISLTGADGIILAHHADDQAETFLMRLIRGAGPDGMESMDPEENMAGLRVLRPMLSLRRGEIRQALREDGIAWREDSSNLDESYLRNRIRLELIPEMERISSGAAGRISRAAGLIREDNRFLNGEASKLVDRLSEGSRIDADSLCEVPDALKSRILRMWWNGNGPALKERGLNSIQTEELIALTKRKQGRVNLPGGMIAVRGRKYLHLTSGKQIFPGAPVPFDAQEVSFGNYTLTAGPSEGNPGDGKKSQEVPQGFTDGCVLRTRRPGDRIRPFGSKGSRKLQDYLTDRHVDEPFRDRIPLLCRENEVLLVCGVGAGNIPAWDPDHDPVRLTWHGDIPWMK